MGGMGIFRVGPDAMNLGAIVETLGDNGARTLMIQRYIPAIKEGDKRILLIGGEGGAVLAGADSAGHRDRAATWRPAGWAGAPGAERARPRDRRDAGAGPVQGSGLLLVGLDVIGDCLTEVNVTSPTCFQEITQQTGFNVAAMFVDALEAAVNNK